jgi:N4-(beta-N-acetylglucosaminyl)-L-asparaginase
MKNIHRRKFIHLAGLASAMAPLYSFVPKPKKEFLGPLVISTWDAGIRANEAAWKILSQTEGHVLDAVEKGVMITESENNCCVGLSGNPDREGIVTLDASIMDDQYNIGSVAALERIAHPISVARAVMEKTPHVMLVGEGAQQFAVSQGFELMPQQLSPDADKAYHDWLKKSEYHPLINIENSANKDRQHGPFAPDHYDDGTFNHDTIGMVAIDGKGRLSGACTTSGMGFKMRGRVGDSPIIGAGLYVDNQVGAATATGHGEEMIRIAGCHQVVEYMRAGHSPEKACRMAVERALQMRGDKLKEKQIGFIAVNKNGEHGAFALQKGFTYSVQSNQIANQVFKADSLW